MKKAFLSLITVIGFTAFASAQTHYKKDGTPDMRYRENRTTYGSIYSSPSYSSPSYSSPSYSSPSYSSPSYSSPSYSSPSISNQTYSNPYTGSQSSYPSYPTTKSGNPDMRYKENRSLYGY